MMGALLPSEGHQFPKAGDAENFSKLLSPNVVANNSWSRYASRVKIRGNEMSLILGIRR